MRARHVPPMSFQFPDHLTPDFSLSLKEEPTRWVVQCKGVLDVPNAAQRVQPELLKLHAAAIAAKVGLVRLDLKQVEYMNSSGLKSFMAWFLTAANAKDCTYTIEVGYDPERSWQQMSLRPMERLAPKTVKLVALEG